MGLFIEISIFIFGAVIGSFLNCLIFRLHSKESMLGRSHCMLCEKKIPWYDNIPILSYLLLMGKCRHCKKDISSQYPIIEFVTALLFLLAYLVRFSHQSAAIDEQFLILKSSFLILLRDWFVISVMVIVFVYDLRWYLILDKVMLPSMAVVLLFDFLLSTFEGEPLKYLAMSLFSGIIGGGFFLLQFVISKGKWIGGGDIRLGFLMGLVLGWPTTLLALALAYISGAIAGIFLILTGKKQFSSKLPFGVFLSLATVASLFWGGEIMHWYLHLYF